MIIIFPPQSSVSTAVWKESETSGWTMSCNLKTKQKKPPKPCNNTFFKSAILHQCHQKKSYAKLLAQMVFEDGHLFTGIFNLSLCLAVVPKYLKPSLIKPMTKQTNISNLNDYHMVALTPKIMKCFERLLVSHIKATIPASLGSDQFAYITQRFLDDTIPLPLQCSDIASTPPNSSSKAFRSSLCMWILNFLSHCLWAVRAFTCTLIAILQ